jgi:hypothetical protein
VLPLLYLHGLSCGDFVPALEQFPGSGAGLSASTVTRLTTTWQGDYQAFTNRDLAGPGGRRPARRTTHHHHARHPSRLTITIHRS